MISGGMRLPQHDATTEYRVVGAAAPDGGVDQEPGLEDAYVWLMRSAREAAAAA
jgi:hypothetical protein